MIGKSYDGTLANGVAATGVEGLKTIVPISAISDWYNYSRTGRHPPQHELPGRQPQPTVTTGPNPPEGVDLPNRRPLCADFNAFVNTIDGDAHGDINEFWHDRDYIKDAARSRPRSSPSTASRTTTSGWTSVDLWWEASRPTASRASCGCCAAGHTDPFESRRAEWVDTLHRWFDHSPARRRQRHRDGAARSRSRTRRTSGTTTRTGRSRAPRRSTCSCAAPARPRPARSAGSAGGARGTTLSFVGSNSTSETTLHELARGRADEPARLPLPAAQGDVRLSGTAHSTCWRR